MLMGLMMGACAVCAVGPAVLFCVNLRRYAAPPEARSEQRFSVSVLIPARDEEANIAAALRCVLASRGVELEVLVLDDDSSDGTGEIVRKIAAEGGRVRLVAGRGLPAGWNGKQHACWVLANEAAHPLLVFLDADVRAEPELLVRMAAFRAQQGISLVSGFPRLITVTWLEKLLLPLIHFVLLGFLPMGAMRRSTKPSFAAGCGQFMLLERKAYFASGGHSALRESMHDGLRLPRALREAGYRTDLADITALASVRMYDSAEKVWHGLAKNATEGIATTSKIVPLTLLLVLGQVVPAAIVSVLFAAVPLLFLFREKIGALGIEVEMTHPTEAKLLIAVLFVTLLGSYVPRLIAVRRFRQPLGSALLHPVGILTLLTIQWYALGRKLVGRPVGWRQRSYSSETGTQVG